MITKQEKDLISALEYANIAELPKEWQQGKSKRIWVSAILKIRKSDMSTSYAFAYNNYNSSPQYVKVWGAAAAIAEVIGIYPIAYLEKDYLPTFKDKADMLAKLAVIYDIPQEKLDSLTDEQAKELTVKYAIGRQILFMKQQEK